MNFTGYIISPSTIHCFSRQPLLIVPQPENYSRMIVHSRFAAVFCHRETARRSVLFSNVIFLRIESQQKLVDIIMQMYFIVFSTWF